MRISSNPKNTKHFFQNMFIKFAVFLIRKEMECVMRFKTPYTTLCLLSLAVPALGHGNNIWLFTTASKAAPIATESNSAGSSEIAMATKSSSVPQVKEEKKCRKNWEGAITLGAGYRHDHLSQRYNPRKSGSAERLKFKYNGVDSVMALVRLDGRIGNFLAYLEGTIAL
jgi:hypothetical protein